MEDTMRLDKFLKVSRIIKRRTVANSACGVGRITCNGRPAKAGHKVKAGDVVTIEFGDRPLTVRITKVAESVRKEDADSMFEVIEG